MCHHYIAAKLNADDFSISPRWMLKLELPVMGFYPLQSVPNVRLNDDGERELFACQWGLLPRWWKPTAKSPKRQSFQRKCFNARSETVATLPSYRDAFKHRRCLMPATAFFEKGHYFRLRDDTAFAFAALWERWEDGNESVESCTLLTTEPNEEVRSVGHHRMPVILTTDEEYSRWLDPEIIEFNRLADLCNSFPSGELVVHQAS